MASNIIRRPNLVEFEKFDTVEIVTRFYGKTDAAIAFCRHAGLLATKMTCSKCGLAMRESPYPRAKDGLIWRCNRSDCRTMTSIRRGSFFDGSHLEFWQVLALTWQWSMSVGRARSLCVDHVMKEVRVGSSTTVVDWFQFCRDVTVSYFQNNHAKIGGPGKIVEIDESVFARRKYHVGRLIPQKWVLGGYDVETHHGFLESVEKRDHATLIPIIVNWVEPGTIIHTDFHGGYNPLPAYGYTHSRVNHSQNFVDPVTGTTTNHVEAMWKRVKAKFKAMNGCKNADMIDDYLKEFMWAQRFGKSPFYHFWHQIADELYVVP